MFLNNEPAKSLNHRSDGNTTNSPARTACACPTKCNGMFRIKSAAWFQRRFACQLHHLIYPLQQPNASMFAAVMSDMPEQLVLTESEIGFRVGGKRPIASRERAQTNQLDSNSIRSPTHRETSYWEKSPELQRAFHSIRTSCNAVKDESKPNSPTCAFFANKEVCSVVE